MGRRVLRSAARAGRARGLPRTLRPVRWASPEALAFLRGRDAHARLRELLARRAQARPLLGALAVAFVAGRGHQALGFRCLGDWAGERIGVGARTLREWARVWRALCGLPRLRRAVLEGEVSWAVARLVTPLATAETEEACLVGVRGRTVRGVEALVAGVRAAEGPGGEALAQGVDAGMARVRVRLRTTRDGATRWVAACELARRAAGEELPTWECAEAIAAEAAASFGAAEAELPERPVRSARDTHTSLFGSWRGSQAREPGDFVGRRAVELDARMRRVMCEVQAADLEIGRILGQVLRRGLYRELGYACFEDYVREALDLAPRTARRLVRIARGPGEVATAFREGRITLLQAEILLRGGEVEFAERVTLRRLRDEVPERQVDFVAPPEVAALFLGMVGKLGLERVLEVALRGWLELEGGVRPEIRRDGYRCTVPGCTARRNLESHHIVFRSRGGSDAAGNRTTLCWWHHHKGVHEGRVAIQGRAPDALCFELGVGRFGSGEFIQ